VQINRPREPASQTQGSCFKYPDLSHGDSLSTSPCPDFIVINLCNLTNHCRLSLFDTVDVITGYLLTLLRPSVRSCISDLATRTSVQETPCIIEPTAHSERACHSAWKGPWKQHVWLTGNSRDYVNNITGSRIAFGWAACSGDIWKESARTTPDVVDRNTYRCCTIKELLRRVMSLAWKLLLEFRSAKCANVYMHRHACLRWQRPILAHTNTIISFWGENAKDL